MENNNTSKKEKLFSIHLLPIGIIVLGIVACFICSTISNDYWDFLGLLIIISFAALLSGTFFGFLFGIPKLNKNYNPTEDYERTNKYNPNTNLEDISDWLTKIIIGVTLTQLIKIPNYLESIANYILATNKCEFNCDYARPIIISDIIFFIIAGFIIGYFYTRLYLPNLFVIMEENKRKEAEISIWREGNKKESIKSEIPKGKTKLSYLTEDEIVILKRIISQGNKYTEYKILKFNEYAAVNVLLSKGIIEVTQGGTFRTGATLSIVDKEILNELD